jgi:pantetheine-phosphate adenylyltransferase
MTAFSDHSFFEKAGSLTGCIEHEMQQFRLHQSMRLHDYLRERKKFLASQTNAASCVDYLSNFKPIIGVFAGSFNPFHKGHYNVLQKAEKIFDKVIVAFGNNPEKGERKWGVPASISNRQIESYNGLLTDFIGSLGHDAVVIRGLRNSTDFQYEQNQYRYIQELMPDIRIVSIFCDKEFEHISSSGIRTLEKFNRHQHYLLD